MEVRFHRGLHLPEPGLWLDPRDSKPSAFISHAHADHVARHGLVLCSEVTAVLLRQRFGLTEKQLQPVAFHVPVVRDGFRMRLLPAGHIPGSAMLHVTRLADNATLLYTGDFKTRRNRTTEAAVFLTADTLVMETTFGLPGFEFPNQLEVEAQVLRFIDDSFADGETPVLLCYSLGKAQEALALLTEHGIPVLLHATAAAMTRACRDAGVPGLPEPVEFDGHAPAGHVLLAPPAALRTHLFKGLKARRTAMLSGWALQPGAKYRYGVDAMIPLSDHADYPGLMECVQRVRPRKVITVHGYASAFAADLRARQIDAHSAAGDDQLELSIQRPPHARPAPRHAWHKRVDCEMAGFSDVCRLLEETGSRVAKTRFLAAYLTHLEDGALRIAAGWLADLTPGKRRAMPGVDALTLRHALAAVPGARPERWREIRLTEKDPVRIVKLTLQELSLQPEALDLTTAKEFIDGFHAAGAGMARIHRLAARFASLHPTEAAMLARLMVRSPALEVPIPCIIEAIAAAFHATPADVTAAVNITGSIAETAVLARRQQLAQASPPAAMRPPAGTPPPAADGELPFLL